MVDRRSAGQEQRLIKTLPRKGFRFVGPVREAEGAAVGAVADNPVERSKPALTLPDKPSIAVLPFHDLSGDPEQEYFADGIADDVLTTLSKIQEVLVIARASSFVFKGQARDIREIGQIARRSLCAGRERSQGRQSREIGGTVDRQPERQPCVGRPFRGRPRRRVRASGPDNAGDRRRASRCG